MLRELHVENLALIDQLDLRFEPGFTVLTGETGAGKSIVVDSLALLLGGRASAELVRTGAEEALVEGAFELLPPAAALLEEMGFPAEEGIAVISREIARSGRSRCRINGRLATVGALSQIGERLMELHGQHENQSLLRTEAQLALLDLFGGPPLLTRRAQVEALYGTWRALRAERENLIARARERAQRVDLLQFQVAEIREARLRLGETEELESERSRLSHADRLVAETSQAHALLSDGGPEGVSAIDMLGRALDGVRAAAAIDGTLQAVCQLLESALAQAQEASRELRLYAGRVEADPERLAEVEQRLDLIQRLERKYGESVEAILAYAKRAEAELEALVGSEQRLQQIETELEAAEAALAREALALQAERRAVAERLQAQIESELAELNMGRTRFEVRFGVQEDPRGIALPQGTAKVAVDARGIDQVEFLIAPNPGEEPKPLARVASGGELSRIMLAMKTLLAHGDDTPTLIFDEVDAGIGGRAAQAVALKLGRLGRLRQVLCVTHLPQIASMADHHYLIEKETVGGRTRTTVRPLSREGRIHELARMLGGAALTDTTLEHAREMLDLASRAKQAG